MVAAAPRFFARATFVCALLAFAPATAPAQRAAPSRPSAAAVPPAPRFTIQKIAGVEYVGINEVAPWLGLGRGPVQGQKFIFIDRANPARKLELEANSRLAVLDGLKIYMGSPATMRRGELHLSRIDVERTLVARVRPASVPSVPPQPRIVALDAGHGGDDPGMLNRKFGLQEKVLTLDVVMRAKKLLESAGYEVVLTRRDDKALASNKRSDLLERAEVANRAGADLFVSVHFNSLFPDTRTSGTEIYVYPPQHQRSSAAWGFRAVDDTRHEAYPVNRFDAWSGLLAHQLHREIVSGLQTQDRGQKTFHLLVLQQLKCPAVLVESVFLSNDVEARRAATPEYRQKIAQAIFEGVHGYATAVQRLRQPAAAAQKKSRRSVPAAN
jgi:N-acetylmuramoyl-L-alanine amidase